MRARTASKKIVGTLDNPLEFGGTTIAAGDLIVLDGDGALAVPAGRVAAVLEEAARRDASEVERRARYLRGELSYDLDGLRALVEGAPRP